MGLTAELHERLAAELEATGATGAASGIWVDGAEHLAAGGTANAEHPTSIGPDTLFQVASITKTFTSATVAMLVEDGLLAFDDPLSRHLPELAAATGLDLDAITVELALSHQAGFEGDHLLTHRSDDLADLRDAERIFPPGTGFSYNNAGFSLVGAAIEAVTGEPFDVVVRRRLLRPLGLRSACFTADRAITNPVALPHWVAGGESHVLRGGGWQGGWELAPSDRPAGGLIASLRTILAWGRFQLDGRAVDGTRLLSDESLARLHAPVVRSDAIHEIGLDWFVRDRDGTTTIGHGGETAGYCSDLVVVPAARAVVVTLTNATNGGLVYQAIRRWALERGAGVAERDPEPDPSVTVDVDRLTGHYEQAMGAYDLTAGPEPGTVRITPVPVADPGDRWLPPVAPPVTLAFWSPDHAVSVGHDGPRRVVRFADGDGPCPWFTWGARRILRRT